jgi:hypothetical protein
MTAPDLPSKLRALSFAAVGLNGYGDHIQYVANVNKALMAAADELEKMAVQIERLRTINQCLRDDLKAMTARAGASPMVLESPRSNDD